MKKEQKTELTKEKILKAGIMEFGTNGYAAGSLNNICNTGIPKGLIYHNFENKDAVYLACVNQCFAELTKYLQEQVLQVDLQNYIDARMNYFNKNPYMARLFFEAVLQPPQHLQQQIHDYRYSESGRPFRFPLHTWRRHVHTRMTIQFKPSKTK